MRYIRLSRECIGPRVLFYLVLRILTGLFLFAAELGFAYGLQAFLVVIDVMPRAQASLPAWFPATDLILVLSAVVCLGILRTSLQYVQVYTAGASQDVLSAEVRQKIVHWAFHSPSASAPYVTTLFKERVVAAGNAITYLEKILVFLPAAVLLWMSLVYLSPIPTLAATGVLGVIGFGMRALDRRIRQLGESVAFEEQNTNQRLLNSIKNLLLMQIYGTQELEEKLAAKSLEKNASNMLGYWKLSGIKYSLPQILGLGLMCAVTLHAKKTNPAVGNSFLITYFYLFIRFTQNFSESLRTVATFNFHWPQLKSLLEWWEKARTEIKRPVTKPGEVLEKLKESPGWEIQNLSFAYKSDTALENTSLFQNLNLSLLPKKTLVILGPSGVGKSSLLNLMIGNLKPSSGSVNLKANGHSEKLNDKLQNQLLRSVGYVGPESFLIDGTIRQNLLYGLEMHPTNEEIEKALQLTECGFVHALPSGLEHKITEQGQGLSAGQKQRLSLARALLRKPKALILDEATSNLDAATEQKLIATLRGLKNEMTILIVSHRPALLELADQTLELK